MRTTARTLIGFEVHADDGDLGHVADLFFDDKTWTLRYFVVETRAWLRRRRVLISPLALKSVDLAQRRISLALTCGEIAHSPDIDTDMPVSRQMELRYRNYFAWPAYWLAGYYVPEIMAPIASPRRRSGGLATLPDTAAEVENSDPHLRSARSVVGHDVMSNDGDAGKVRDFVITDDAWRLQDMIVELGAWPHHRSVAVSTYWVSSINWSLNTVVVASPREAIARAATWTAGSRGGSGRGVGGR